VVCFPQVSLRKPCIHRSFPHSATWPAHLIFLDLINLNYIWWRVQIIKFLVMQSSPLPCHLISLRPKYIRENLNSRNVERYGRTSINAYWLWLENLKERNLSEQLWSSSAGSCLWYDGNKMTIRSA
jgi:hypothetical protein